MKIGCWAKFDAVFRIVFVRVSYVIVFLMKSGRFETDCDRNNCDSLQVHRERVGTGTVTTGMGWGLRLKLSTCRTKVVRVQLPSINL